MNSIGRLYIECQEAEKKDAFSVDKELSGDEYVKMLREYSATIGSNTSRSTCNSYLNSYELSDNKSKVTYSSALSKVYDISGQLCDVNELYKIQRNGMGVLIFEIIDSDIDESFESEFKFWKVDSMNINNDCEINSDERIKFLPTKDLKFEIDDHLFLLSGCKMYCEYNNLKVALIIKNLKEI